MSAATVAQTASNAYAPTQPGGFQPPGPMATFASDVNILVSGAALFAGGEHLVTPMRYHIVPVAEITLRTRSQESA